MLQMQAFALLLFFIGCGGAAGPSSPPPSGPISTPPSGPTAATGIYVIEEGSVGFPAGVPDKILRFNASANGVVSPTQTIVGPAGYLLGAVAVDADGLIYVSGWTVSVTTISPTTIFVYAADSFGNDPPLRSFQSSAMQGSVLGMAFDSEGRLYVSEFGGTYGDIAVFAKGASGNDVTPLRTLNLDAAQVEPHGMAIGKDGTIYVSDASANARVVAFAPGASGNPLPVRSISGTNTGIQPYVAEFSLDSDDNLYISSIDPVSNVGTINVFSAGADGNIAPMKTIGGNVLNAADGIVGIQVDATGKVYGTAIHIDTSGAWVPSFIFSYDASDSGDIAPRTKFSSSVYDLTFFGTLALH